MPTQSAAAPQLPCVTANRVLGRKPLRVRPQHFRPLTQRLPPPSGHIAAIASCTTSNEAVLHAFPQTARSSSGSHVIVDDQLLSAAAAGMSLVWNLCQLSREGQLLNLQAIFLVYCGKQTTNGCAAHNTSPARSTFSRPSLSFFKQHQSVMDSKSIFMLLLTRLSADVQSLASPHFAFACCSP